MSSVRLSLLGGFSLRAEGQEVSLPKKTQALLVYLALAPARAVTRERLAALLWSEASDAQGRSSLRGALSRLRRELARLGQETGWLEAEALQLPASIETDVAEFLTANRGQTLTELQRACSLYTGDLLLGFGARSLEFDTWLQLEREHLRRQALGAAQRWSELALAGSDDAHAVEALRRWVVLDPVDERPRRHLMSKLARMGRKAQALQEYRSLREALQRELGMNPEPATVALYGELSKQHAVTEPAFPPPNTHEQTIANELLRVITVMLVRLKALSSADFDAEEASGIALQLVGLVERQRRVDGNPVLSAGGDVILACATQRGSEAELMLETALAVRAAVSDMDWPSAIRSSIRITLAQEAALQAPDGQYTGRAIGVVSELVGRAEDGQILAHQSLAMALAGRVLGTPLKNGADALQVTGLGDPADSDSAPFIGRAAELAWLEAQLVASVERSQSQVVIVRAEPGMGKSRLLAALRGRAAARGVACHTLRALDFGQASNSRLLAELTLSLGSVGLDADPQARLACLRAVVEKDGELLPHLVHLLELSNASVPPELTALQQALDTTSRVTGRRLALSHLLAATAKAKPVLLQFEDLHWSSADERAAIADLVRDAEQLPVLFVLSTRPAGDHLDADWRTGPRSSVVSTLELGPLPLADARQFAALHPQLTAELVESCIQRAQGLPLFLDQLLRAAASGQKQLPGSVRASVLGRLDGLSPSLRELTFAAAVLGQRGTLPALSSLAAVSSLTQGSTLSAEVLSSTGLLSLRREEWSFRHALFRDAVYDSLLKATRTALHARAAEWYRGRDTVLYADHLALAGQPGAAQAYLEASTTEAEAQRTVQALYCARRARELADTPRIAFAAACAVGQLGLGVGDTHAALSAFREAVALAEDARAAAEAWLGVASALRVLDRQTEALDALEQARSMLPEDEPELHCKWWRLRGNVMFSLDFDACRDAHEKALLFARLSGSELDEVLAVGGLGDAYFQRGLMLTAHKHFARCVEQCRKIGHWASLLAYLPMSAITRIYQADFARARSECDEALTLAARLGSPRGALLAEVAAADLHLAQAAYERALAHARRAMALARSIGAARFEAEAEGVIGVALFGLGEAQEATDALRRARALAIGSHAAYAGPYVLGHLARVTADPQERQSALLEGERLLEAGAIGSNAMEYFASAIELHLREGNASRALQLAARLEQITSAEPLVWCDLVVRRARAVAAPAESEAARRGRIEAFEREAERIGFTSLCVGIGAR